MKELVHFSAGETGSGGPGLLGVLVMRTSTQEGLAQSHFIMKDTIFSHVVQSQLRGFSSSYYLILVMELDCFC